MRTEERISNYERQAEAARKLFLTYDQERILLRYDLAADRQWIFLTYLNVPCRISRESGQVEEQQEDGRWKRCDSFHTVMTIPVGNRFRRQPGDGARPAVLCQ